MTKPKQIVTAVASGLTVTNWSQSSVVTNLAKATIASNIPSDLSTQLGVTPQTLINQLYNFGSTPSNTAILDYATNLTINSMGNLADIRCWFFAFATGG